MGLPENASDHDFVADLRAAIERYFAAVDRWEAAYQKYYRMPGSSRVSDDLEDENREYTERRRELEEYLPRARRLCLKHGIRDPFSGLLRISLGRYAPQERSDPAIGRSERNFAVKSLAELSAATVETGPGGEMPVDESPREKESLLKRFVSYFY